MVNNVFLLIVGLSALLTCSLGCAIVLGVAMSDDEDREQTLTGRWLILVGGVIFLLVVAFMGWRRLA